MPRSTRFEPSQIKNKVKREEIAHKNKKAKNQLKLKKRLEQAKLEAENPAAKKVCIETYHLPGPGLTDKQKRLEENVPRTLDNTREFDPSTLTADPSSIAGPSSEGQDESAADIASDPFAGYFLSEAEPTIPPKVLITTSFQSSKATYKFCDELVGIFPGAEFIRRKKGKGFEMGRIAAWCADRGYKHLIVVNEDIKKPSASTLILCVVPEFKTFADAITLVHLPNGPTAYFKLTSIELTEKIFVSKATCVLECGSINAGSCTSDPTQPGAGAEQFRNSFGTRHRTDVPDIIPSIARVSRTASYYSAQPT